MPVVAVVNRKGGSGKSTLATHLAAYCSTNGMSVMLGDVDKQQSTQSWLRQRALQQLPDHPAIVGWNVDPKHVVRPPAGIGHVVLDTPGGLRGFDLARVVMYADAVLMPICNSMFDRDSAGECFAELMTLPRIASGRCRVAAIGMRLDARTRAGDILKEWARAHKLPFIGVLRETQTYVRCVEQGLTLFDLPAAKFEADLAQWKPILRWLGPVVQPVQPVQQNTRMGPVTETAVPPRAAEVRPVVPSALGSAGGAAAGPVLRPVVRPVSAEPGRVVGHAPSEVTIPAYLQVNGASTVFGGSAAGVPQPQPERAAIIHTSVMNETVDAPVASQLKAPVDDLRRATLATATLAAATPNVLPAEPVRAPNGTVKAVPASPNAARPQPQQRVQPRPAIGATRPKTIASRLGSFIDSLPIPRFLQRDS